MKSEIFIRYAGMVMVATVLMGGCKKEEPTATPPPPMSKSTGTTPSSPTSVAPTPAVPVPSATTRPASTQPSTSSSAGGSTADLSHPATAAPSQASLDAVTQLVKDNKLDQAGAALKKIEADKAGAPAAVQSKIEDARKMLDAARNVNPGSVKVPDPSTFNK